MNRMLMEVNWFNIVLIVIGMVKLVVKLVVSMVRDNIVLVVNPVVSMVRRNIVLMRVRDLLNLMGQSLGVIRVVHRVALDMPMTKLMGHLVMGNWVILIRLVEVHSLVHEATSGFMAAVFW